MEEGALADAAVAQSVADTQSFWALRDACAEFFPTLGPARLLRRRPAR